MSSLNYASGYVTSKNNGFLDVPFWASVVICGLTSALLTYLLLPTLTKRGKPLPDYVSMRGVTWIVFWSSVMFCGLLWMGTSMIGGALQWSKGPSGPVSFPIVVCSRPNYDPSINRGLPMDFGRVAKQTGYKIYTTEFDTVVHANEAMDKYEAESILGQLALPNRLDYDQTNTPRLEELAAAIPVADSLIGSRLDDINVDPSETSIGILIDTSGSSRYEAATYARVLPSICKSYEDRGFNVLVAGHTTATWKGGQSREQWHTSGRERDPGRLADLKITIYKDFDDVVGDENERLIALTLTGKYRENIDGEAIAWMADYMLEYGRQNKVMLYVTSDGVPVDDSTLSSNRPGLLDDHVVGVIKEVKASEELTFVPVIAHNEIREMMSDNSRINELYRKVGYRSESELLSRLSDTVADAVQESEAKYTSAPKM